MRTVAIIFTTIASSADCLKLVSTSDTLLQTSTQIILLGLRKRKFHSDFLEHIHQYYSNIDDARKVCIFHEDQKYFCHYFGHTSDITCLEPRFKTVHDTPVCDDIKCSEKDLMKPTHNLNQTFCDEN